VEPEIKHYGVEKVSQLSILNILYSILQLSILNTLSGINELLNVVRQHSMARRESPQYTDKR